MAPHQPTARLRCTGSGLPCFLADADPTLLRLKHEGEGFSRDIWLVVHRDLRRAAPVRAVMDFLIEVVASHKGLALDRTS